MSVLLGGATYSALKKHSKIPVFFQGSGARRLGRKDNKKFLSQFQRYVAQLFCIHCKFI